MSPDFSMELGKMSSLTLAFREGLGFEKLKKNAQWILSAAENNAVETAPDRQDHVLTTPCFHFQNSSKHPHACRLLTLDSNRSFIQFLSRVCVVGILQECKSQRYHSRLWTKGWWRNSFSSNRLKVYQNSYCTPAACSSAVVLSGRGYISFGFQDSLWTCSTLLMTSSLPTPPDDCTPPGFHSCLGMWVRAASIPPHPSIFPKHLPQYLLLFVLSSKYTVKKLLQNFKKHNIMEVLSLIFLGFSSLREASCSKNRSS